MMNVEAPRLLKTFRGGIDALAGAIRGSFDQREPRLPGELKALLSRLDRRS